ncbi:MAG: O-methyltransferase, partial [Melioribacteraceae bacterium]|nr:O-methyltransferase [Melioribacteraceae bacterium]
MRTTDSYIESHIKTRSSHLMEMEEFARINHIPIMELVSIEAFLQLLRLQKPDSILEIGSAIGYSAIRMASALPQAKITTIEKDENRAELARTYIEKNQLTTRIQLITGDALDIELLELASSQFQAIFIDAAKGQYQRFFEKFSPLLPSGGVIYCDNMLMRGFTEIELNDVPRRKRTMVRNLQTFTTWLMNHEEYITTFLPIG